MSNTGTQRAMVGLALGASAMFLYEAYRQSKLTQDDINKEWATNPFEVEGATLSARDKKELIDHWNHRALQGFGYYTSKKDGKTYYAAFAGTLRAYYISSGDIQEIQRVLNSKDPVTNLPDVVKIASLDLPDNRWQSYENNRVGGSGADKAVHTSGSDSDVPVPLKAPAKK